MKVKVRLASNEPISTVVETVEINTIEDLVALEKKYNNSLILALIGRMLVMIRKNTQYSFMTIILNKGLVSLFLFRRLTSKSQKTFSKKLLTKLD